MPQAYANATENVPPKSYNQDGITSAIFIFHTSSLSRRFDFLSYFSCYKSEADARPVIEFLEDFRVETAAVGLQRFFVI